MKECDLKFDNENYNILKKSKIVGHDLLIFNEKDFRECGLRKASTIRLMKFVKDNVILYMYLA